MDVRFLQHTETEIDYLLSFLLNLKDLTGDISLSQHNFVKWESIVIPKLGKNEYFDKGDTIAINKT